MTDLLQLVRYLIVGGFITVADMVIYNFLTGSSGRMPRIPANIISVTCGMILGFSLHFVLVFQPRELLLTERAMKYIITVGISVYGVQNLVIYTLAELWRGPVRLAQNASRRLILVAAPVKARAPWLPNLSYSHDFIDRMTGKAAAAIAGVIWNFIFFKWFVYA